MRNGFEMVGVYTILIPAKMVYFKATGDSSFGEFVCYTMRFEPLVRIRTENPVMVYPYYNSLFPDSKRPTRFSFVNPCPE